MSERHLDDAIDRAARGMMAVDTDGAFRARLSERLDGSSRRPALFTWPRFAAAGVAAAAITLAVVLPRGSGPTAPPGMPSHAAVEVPAPADPRPARGARDRHAASQTASAAATPGRRPSRGVARQEPPAERLSAPNVTQQVAPGTLVSAAIGDAPAPAQRPVVAPMQPITVAPLASVPIVPEAIVTAPLPEIPQIQVAPLFQTAERN